MAEFSADFERAQTGFNFRSEPNVAMTLRGPVDE